MEICQWTADRTGSASPVPRQRHESFLPGGVESGSASETGTGSGTNPMFRSRGRLPVFGQGPAQVVEISVQLRQDRHP